MTSLYGPIDRKPLPKRGSVWFRPFPYPSIKMDQGRYIVVSAKRSPPSFGGAKVRICALNWKTPFRECVFDVCIRTFRNSFKEQR